MFGEMFPRLLPLPVTAFRWEPSYTWGERKGQVVVFDAREAWLLDGAQWLQIPRSRIETQIETLSIDEVVRRLPDTPDVPDSAFQRQ